MALVEKINSIVVCALNELKNTYLPTFLHIFLYYHAHNNISHAILHLYTHCMYIFLKAKEMHYG